MDSFGLLLISMIDMIFLGAVLRSPTWDECPIYQTSIIVCLPDINLFLSLSLLFRPVRLY